MPKTTTPSTVAPPQPLIMLQPVDQGIQLNAYGLDSAEIIRALRIALVHIAATQAGMQVIDVIINDHSGIALQSPPSHKKTSRMSKRAPELDLLDDDDDSDLLALMENRP